MHIHDNDNLELLQKLIKCNDTALTPNMDIFLICGYLCLHSARKYGHFGNKG